MGRRQSVLTDKRYQLLRCNQKSDRINETQQPQNDEARQPIRIPARKEILEEIFAVPDCAAAQEHFHVQRRTSNYRSAIRDWRPPIDVMPGEGSNSRPTPNAFGAALGPQKVNSKFWILLYLQHALNAPRFIKRFDLFTYDRHKRFAYSPRCRYALADVGLTENPGPNLCDVGRRIRAAYTPKASQMCQGGDSNSRPRAYESPALPLSYPGVLSSNDIKQTSPDQPQRFQGPTTELPDEISGEKVQSLDLCCQSERSVRSVFLTVLR